MIVCEYDVFLRTSQIFTKMWREKKRSNTPEWTDLELQKERVFALPEKANLNIQNHDYHGI